MNNEEITSKVKNNTDHADDQLEVYIPSKAEDALIYNSDLNKVHSDTYTKDALREKVERYSKLKLFDSTKEERDNAYRQRMCDQQKEALLRMQDSTPARLREGLMNQAVKTRIYEMFTGYAYDGSNIDDIVENIRKYVNSMLLDNHMSESYAISYLKYVIDVHSDYTLNMILSGDEKTEADNLTVLKNFSRAVYESTLHHEREETEHDIVKPSEDHYEDEDQYERVYEESEARDFSSFTRNDEHDNSETEKMGIEAPNLNSDDDNSKEEYKSKEQQQGEQDEPEGEGEPNKKGSEQMEYKIKPLDEYESSNQSDEEEEEDEASTPYEYITSVKIGPKKKIGLYGDDVKIRNYLDYISDSDVVKSITGNDMTDVLMDSEDAYVIYTKEAQLKAMELSKFLLRRKSEKYVPWALSNMIVKWKEQESQLKLKKYDTSKSTEEVEWNPVANYMSSEHDKTRDLVGTLRGMLDYKITKQVSMEDAESYAVDVFKKFDSLMRIAEASCSSKYLNDWAVYTGVNSNQASKDPIFAEYKDPKTAARAKTQLLIYGILSNQLRSFSKCFITSLLKVKFAESGKVTKDTTQALTLTQAIGVVRDAVKNNPTSVANYVHQISALISEMRLSNARTKGDERMNLRMDKRIATYRENLRQEITLCQYTNDENYHCTFTITSRPTGFSITYCNGQYIETKTAADEKSIEEAYECFSSEIRLAYQGIKNYYGYRYRSQALQSSGMGINEIKSEDTVNTVGVELFKDSSDSKKEKYTPQPLNPKASYLEWLKSSQYKLTDKILELKEANEGKDDVIGSSLKGMLTYGGLRVNDGIIKKLIIRKSYYVILVYLQSDFKEGDLVDA